MELSGEKSRSELRDIWSSGPSNGFGGHQQAKALKSQTTDLTMQFEAKLTLDGLMTIVAGIIAFVAVIIQIRSSSRQVRDQIQAQREAEQEDKERRKRAVATAIAFEVDFIYAAFIRGVEALFKKESGTPHFEQRIASKRIERLPFAVYEGCAGQLGGMPIPLVEAVAHFYGEVTTYLITLNELYAALRRAEGASLGDPRWNEVKVLARQVQSECAQAEKLAAEVSKVLCEFADIPRERMTVPSGSK
jgi:hypothetical protein